MTGATRSPYLYRGIESFTAETSASSTAPAPIASRNAYRHSFAVQPRPSITPRRRAYELLALALPSIESAARRPLAVYPRRPLQNAAPVRQLSPGSCTARLHFLLSRALPYLPLQWQARATLQACRCGSSPCARAYRAMNTYLPWRKLRDRPPAALRAHRLLAHPRRRYLRSLHPLRNPPARHHARAVHPHPCQYRRMGPGREDTRHGGRRARHARWHAGREDAGARAQDQGGVAFLDADDAERCGGECAGRIVGP